MGEPASDRFNLCGTTLEDKYRVVEPIGAGGFGVVYRGEHVRFGEPIAIKCLQVAGKLDREQRQELMRQLEEEGAVLHRLSKRCSAIVQALDVGELSTPDGAWVPYLVLEWLEGRPLSAELSRRRHSGRPYTLEQALDLLQPAVEALALAHRQKIAHRDVKPENLYLCERDGGQQLKVLDFGIAKVLASHAAFTASPAATHERPTAFTPRYGAPEQFNKRLGATGPWTDVFALALIVVEMVSGQRALDGDNPTQLYVAATDPRARPTLRLVGVDPGDDVEEVLDRALAIEPTDRFPDAAAFWDALKSAVTGETDEGASDVSATGDFVADRGLGILSDPPPALTPTITEQVDDRIETAATVVAATQLPSATGALTSEAPTTVPSAPPDFEIALVNLAKEGTQLTVANVMAHLSVTSLQAEHWLEALTQRGRLARREDEELGATYTVRGLTVPPSARLEQHLKPLQTLLLRSLNVDPRVPVLIPPERQKSVPVGVVIGAIVPGVGLFYAAPLSTALLVTILGYIAIGISDSAPMIGNALGTLGWIAFAVLSGTLGGAFTWHYNRNGRRMPFKALRRGMPYPYPLAGGYPAQHPSQAHPSQPYPIATKLATESATTRVPTGAAPVGPAAGHGTMNDILRAITLARLALSRLPSSRLAVAAVTWVLVTVFATTAHAEDGKLTIHVFPRDAEVLIDGTPQPERAADAPFVLSEGEHRVEARKDGYAGTWQTVEIKAGEQRVLELRLAKTSGELSVFPHRPDATVEIDGEQVGRGAITRALSTGLHRVRVYTSNDDVQAIEVVVSANGKHSVQQSSEGLLATDAAPNDRETSFRPGSGSRERVGIYMHGYFALMSPFGDVVDHTRDDGVQGGMGGSLRVGYRFFDWLGAELNAHFSWLNVNGTVGTNPEVSYRFYSVRLGPGLRFFAPAKTDVRFVAIASGGFVWDILNWDPDMPGTHFVDGSGPNGFGQLDVGVEFEFDGVLTDIVFTNAVKSTGGLKVDGAATSAFDGAPIFVLGPAISIGYGVW